MTDNRTTEPVSRREATTLLEEFLCGYQNILLSRGINASEAVCKQNELIDEYAERIEQAIDATPGNNECEFRPFKDEDWSEPNAVRGVCSECSALMYGKDNYCPNCGKAVKR